MSTLHRLTLLSFVLGAFVRLWAPVEAQGMDGPVSQAPPASQGQTNLPPSAPYGDDPYAPPVLGGSKAPSDEDVIEPPNITSPPDSSTSNREVPTDNVAPLAPAPVQQPDLIHFENTMQDSFSETTETRREQVEEMIENPAGLGSLPPPESLPSLSIIPALRLDPITVGFGLRYETLYDNNILLLNSERQKDFEHVLAPRFALSWGDAGFGDYGEEDVSTGNAVLQKPNFLDFNYEPLLKFFQRYGQYNTFDQQLGLNAQYALTKTLLHQSLDYTHSSDPDRELQGRTSRDFISAETDATYRASERFAYELDGTALVRDFQQGIDSDEGRLQFWTRYTVSPAMQVSFGPAVGALLPEQGTSQVYQQIWLGTQNQIGNHLNVYLSIAGEFREADDSSEVRTTPLFSAIVRYAPSTETQVELSAIRQIFSSSNVVDQDFVASRIDLKATQRLWQTYKVDVDFGYENATYFAVGSQANEVDSSAAVPRSDNYPTARVEFSYARFEDLQAGIFYQYRQNFSSQMESSFSDQQAGVQFRIGY